MKSKSTRTAGLLLCLGLGVVAQQPVRADNPDQITQFRTLSSCYQCDLSAANFDDESHPGAMANGASLYGASLQGTDLTNADLGNANLGMAILIDARLTGANLVGAKLWRANLVGAKLDRATLSPGALAGTITDTTTVCPDGTAGPCS